MRISRKRESEVMRLRLHNIRYSSLENMAQHIAPGHSVPGAICLLCLSLKVRFAAAPPPKTSRTSVEVVLLHSPQRKSMVARCSLTAPSFRSQYSTWVLMWYMCCKDACVYGILILSLVASRNISLCSGVKMMRECAQVGWLRQK